MTINIPDFMPVLGRGNHDNPEQGACVMEMVSFVAGEEWSDTPECTNMALAMLAQRVNDFVSDDNRNVIAHMVPRFIGTSKLESALFLSTVAEKLAESGEFGMFGYQGSFRLSSADLLSSIKEHFNFEKDIEKRLTNEEYDQKAMRILEIALDTADEMLERGEYAVTKEEAFAKIASIPCQIKVNA